MWCGLDGRIVFLHVPGLAKLHVLAYLALGGSGGG